MLPCYMACANGLYTGCDKQMCCSTIRLYRLDKYLLLAELLREQMKHPETEQDSVYLRQ
jgi:hypothetical protein